jgi:heme oxygenase (mycobilin-producing)
MSKPSGAKCESAPKHKLLDAIDNVGTRELHMLVALSRFTIANGMAEEVRAAFRQRPHLVDRAPGFLGMEVMSPVGDAAEIWLVTRWCDERSYHSWHRSHKYHESHKGIPRGLKLVSFLINEVAGHDNGYCS